MMNDHSKARILAIDDTPANILVLGAALEDEFELTIATSGMQGLERVREELPDVILLDVMMPGLDGFEVCSRLKADPLTADIPVIFLTAMGDTEAESRGLQLGAVDYITKPFNLDTARLRIANHVALKRLRDWSTRFFACGNDLFCVTDKQGRIRQTNPAWEKLLGYPADHLQGLDLLSLAHPEDRAVIATALDRLAQGDTVSGLICRYRSGDGTYRNLEWNVGPAHGLNYAVARDITEKLHHEEQLRLFAAVFEKTREGIVITDRDKHIVAVNDAYLRNGGHTREDAIGKRPPLIHTTYQDPAFYEEMWGKIKENGSWRGEVWNRLKTGELQAQLLSISAVPDEQGCVSHYIGVYSDITDLKNHEAELERIAHYDALTGVPNRRLLGDRLNQAILHSLREHRLLAVCYLDLDGFKPVNDTLGHEAGDQVLIEITQRISRNLRSVDTLARIGGDEFVLILAGLEHAAQCETTIGRLLKIIAQPIGVCGVERQVSASIGVAFYSSTEKPEDLLHRADSAMYEAKQGGGNRVHFAPQPPAA